MGSQELLGVALSRRYGWRSIRLAAILDTSGDLVLEEAKVDSREKNRSLLSLVLWMGPAMGRLPERMNQRSALVIQNRQGLKCGTWEQTFPSLGHYWNIRKPGPTCWIGACLSLERWDQHWCSRSLERAHAKFKDVEFRRSTCAVTSPAFLEIGKVSILQRSQQEPRDIWVLTSGLVGDSKLPGSRPVSSWCPQMVQGVVYLHDHTVAESSTHKGKIHFLLQCLTEYTNHI